MSILSVNACLRQLGLRASQNTTILLAGMRGLISNHGHTHNVDTADRQKVRTVMGLTSCVGFLMLICGCSTNSTTPTIKSFIVYAHRGQTLKEVVDGLPSTGGEIVLGVGAWMSGYHAGSFISKPNVRIRGSGMPGYNSSFTGMTGGTIVLGVLPVSSGADYFTVRDLGIDAGQNYINANNGGVATDAFAIFNNGQTLNAPPIQSPVIENVSCLGYSPTAPNHCMLVENVKNAYVRNVRTVMNCHGLVLKGTNSFVDGVYARGHGIDSVIVKSDVYAPSSQDSLLNITIAPLLSPGDTKGIIVLGVGAPVVGITFAGVTIHSPLAWGIYVQGASATTYVSGLTLHNVGIDYQGGSPPGEYCMQFVQYVSNVKVYDLSCKNMWAGVSPYLPQPDSFGNFEVRNSTFANIATDAIETYGSWSVLDSQFSFVGGNGIVNPFGTTTVAGNTFSNISGSDMLSTGGSFMDGP